MLDEVSNFVLSFLKFHRCREFKELCGMLIFRILKLGMYKKKKNNIGLKLRVT